MSPPVPPVEKWKGCVDGRGRGEVGDEGGRRVEEGEGGVGRKGAAGKGRGAGKGWGGWGGGEAGRKRVQGLWMEQSLLPLVNFNLSFNVQELHARI